MNDWRLRLRTILRAAALIILVAACNGCRSINPFRSPANNVPVVFSTAPDLNGLLQAINANTAEVRQLSSNVQIRMNGIPPLSGTLIAEKPHRLRLKAGLIGISEMGVDAGSNDQEFWIWSKSSLGGQSPAMYFAKHAEFNQLSPRLSIPIQPQWIIEALGLVDLPRDGSIQGPSIRKDGRLELRQETATANGRLTKIMVVDPKTGLIQQQSIYGTDLQLIAYVNAAQHQYFEKFHASLPRHIELVVIGPDRRANSMTVDLAGHEINQLYGDPQRQWEMPRPTDAQWIDLAKSSMGGFQAP